MGAVDRGGRQSAGDAYSARLGAPRRPRARPGEARRNRRHDLRRRHPVRGAEGRGGGRHHGQPLPQTLAGTLMSLPAPKKVVLAYSGGLDTSIILKWLQTEYRAEVVTFTADLGQGEEVEPARRKAELLG